MQRFALSWGLIAAGLGTSRLAAQSDQPVTPNCSNCAEWNAPQAPFRIFGHSYYVGPHGLSSILITSDAGHILIDGGLMESARVIAANIRSLGFRVEDIKLILNSHVHYDHAGGIAELQRLSGAQVAASPASAVVLERGKVGPDDPQYGALADLAPVNRVRRIVDGEALRVGSLVVTARFTAGHTPGGTSWAWEACENGRCLQLVYADSQTPVSAEGFSFSKSTTYPNAIADFRRGQALLEQLRCDILVTTHPGASSLWERLADRESGNPAALIDPGACRALAQRAKEQLAERLEEEKR